MGVGITYMGTKRTLTPLVAGVISGARAGPLLDAFSGMCSVGEAIAAQRQVWTNDTQVFASLVGEALFTSSDLPERSDAIAENHFDQYEAQQSKLRKLFSAAIELENEVLQATNHFDFQTLRQKMAPYLAQSLASLPDGKFDLFTRIYADTYFGIQQSIELDSIVKALSKSKRTSDHWKWKIIALGRAMLRSSNSTGHFAQFLEPKEGSYRVFQRQRRRRIWEEWIQACDQLAPVGTRSWRSQNRSFRTDAGALITKLAGSATKPAVVYADPPYTDDQYSRFYHLLETLVLYDYPTTTGKGRYRPGRFTTPFSLISKAPTAMESLAVGTSKLGADLVLSYPRNGLVYKAGEDPLQILARHFRTVDRVETTPYLHSTLGASKGDVKTAVIEQVFLARAA